MNRKQRKYEKEKQRFLSVLQQSYELNTEKNRLQWELEQCRDPSASPSPEPKEANKPFPLRNSEEGKPLYDGESWQKKSWRRRRKELSPLIDQHKSIIDQLEYSINGLTWHLAECSEQRRDGVKGIVGRREQTETSPDEVTENEAIKTGNRRQRRPELAVPEDVINHFKRVELKNEQLKQKIQVFKKELEKERREREREKAAWEGMRMGLEEKEKELETELEKKATALANIQGRVEKLDAIERELVPFTTLIDSLQKGQRHFLDQHNDPHLDNALASLIRYSLFQLALALASGDKENIRAQAMYANLYTIVGKLKTYKGQPINGFDKAFETLHNDGVGGYADALPRSKKKPGPAAKPFQMCLKYLRDDARLDLRPFFYDVDEKGRVLSVG